MKKRVALAVVAVLVIAGAVAAVKALQIRAMIGQAKTMVIPPTVVASAEVRAETWQPTLAAVGSVTAVQGVTVSAELGGLVKEIAFESGAAVQKDDLLVQLDVSSEEAQLRSAEANLSLTQFDMDRAQDLQQRRVIAKAEWDAAEARHKQAMSQVDNMRALIAKKTIRAPFAGRAGIRQVNVGQVLNAGAPVVSLQSLDPVYVDFSLPQQHLAELQAGMAVRVMTDTFPEKQFSGELTAMNPNLDAATRSVPLQATLKNPDHLLRPGMFARVEVVLSEKREVLIVPATAIAYAPFGDSVFVIEDQPDEATKDMRKGIRQQFVRLGEAQGDFVAVTSGLKAGELVVSSGVFKLRNNMAVKVENALGPKPVASPNPPDA